MTFYTGKGQQYLETDVLLVSLEVSLLQVRDEMWFPQIEALNNVVL